MSREGGVGGGSGGSLRKCMCVSLFGVLSGYSFRPVC